jgi:hypothetical protein
MNHTIENIYQIAARGAGIDYKHGFDPQNNKLDALSIAIGLGLQIAFHGESICVNGLPMPSWTRFCNYMTTLACENAIDHDLD